MWRHVVAVSAMAMVLVAVLIYCITPDAFDGTFSVAGYRARQLLGSTSVSGIMAVVSGRVSGLVRGAPAKGSDAVPGSRAQRPPAGRTALHTGPDPFRPYGAQEPPSRAKMAAVWLIRRLFGPQALGGLLFLISGLWAGKRIQRRKQVRSGKEERMAACLAKAVRQTEHW